jgi:hypothetical protein
MYVRSKQKCSLGGKLLVTIYGYYSMFNPPIFGIVMMARGGSKGKVLMILFQSISSY